MNSTAIKGIYSMFKEAFRSGVPELGEVLLDKMHNPAPRSELFPYRFFNKEKSIYYLDEGIAGFTFECNTIVGVKPEIYKQLSMLFDEQMPYGGVIEVLLLASDNIDPAIERWRKGRVKNEGVFKKLENYKSEFFKSYNKRKDKNFKHRDYRLFVSYSNKIDKKKGDSAIVKFKDRLKVILFGLGCNPEITEPQEFIELVKEITNYPDFKSKRYSEYETISDQIIDTSNSLLVADNGVMTKGGEFISRVYEIDSYPSGKNEGEEGKGFSISQMLSLLGDIESDYMQVPSRFAICYTISNELTEANQEAYRKKGEIIVNQPSYLKKFNRALEAETEEWSEIMEKNLKNRERFLRSSFLVMITADADRIDYTEQSLMSIWRKQDFIIKGLNNFHLPGLLSFCPFLNKTGLGKLLKMFKIKRTVLSSEPKALMPIHGEWKGSDNGGMILTGRLGQVFSWNNYVGANNYNACVIGETGSGKSVFLQEFVMTHLSQGTKVFVVDIGNSFKKTCHIMGGDHLNFGSGSNACLNPFIGIPEEGVYDPNIEEDDKKPNLTQDSLNYVKKIVQKMAAPMHGTTDLQNASLSYAIYMVWNKYKNKATIDRLIEQLESGDQGKKDLALQLFDFSSKGNFGRFFMGENVIKFDKQLTVLEFEDLRENPELGGVIMQMLAIQIVQQVYLGNRDQKFIILFDEAWYALENFPLFLASMAKTVRKYNGGLIVGTQSLEHFYGGGESQGGVEDTARRSVAQSCGWKVMLKQSPESCDSLVKMRMPEGCVKMVSGLETVKGEYSEMLIYESDKQYLVARLMLDQFSQVLYSSTPSVFSAVERYKKEGLDTGAAVEKVMNEIYKN